MDTRFKGRQVSDVIKVKKVNSDFEKIYKKEIEESRLERMENNRILCKLIEKVGNTNITHNNNNCGNTQTNNVQINNFGHEDLSMLTDTYMRKMVSLPYTAIPKMIKKYILMISIQNRNIRMLNKKDNKLQIRNNGEWKYVDKKDTLQLNRR